LSSRAGHLVGPTGKRFIGDLAETIWTAGFAAAGLLAPRRAGVARELGDARNVLVIAPHPDDEAIGCAGTILLHKRAGARVAVAHVTDGRTSRAFGLSADEMARQRRNEAETCARVLRIDALEWIGLRGGEWRDEQLTCALEGLMARLGPALVYAPSRVDFHPEHLQVARALSRFWTSSLERPAAVRVYPVQVPLTTSLANTVIDVTSEMALACEAMGAFTTQLPNIPRAWRQRRYTARRYRLGQYAEEFWEISPAVYASLHSGDPATAEPEFRGVRELSIADPLAYIVGQSARRRLSLDARRLASMTLR
jgi:LmbE family N-acetylglucosaminyl deacetylase